MVKVKYDKEEEKWITLPPDSPNGIYLDGYLKEKLDNVKRIQKKNWDCVIQIDGMERCGKSTLALTIATYLSNDNLSLNNLAADSPEAAEKLEKLPDESVLIIDEGGLVFSTKEAMRSEQIKLIKVLNVIGQKKMILIIVSPSFFDISKYISVQRSRFLLHCYTDDDLTRGFFGYYGEETKKKLYDIGKKNFNTYSVSQGAPPPDFEGRFTDYKPDFYEEYLKIKQRSLVSAFSKKKEVDAKQVRNKIILNAIEKNKSAKKKLTYNELGSLFGVSDSLLHAIAKENEEIQAQKPTNPYNNLLGTPNIDQPDTLGAEVIEKEEIHSDTLPETEPDNQ